MQNARKSIEGKKEKTEDKKLWILDLNSGLSWVSHLNFLIIHSIICKMNAALFIL